MRCKVGDLAIIVCDPDCGERDIGKLVRVVRPDCLPYWGCMDWVCAPCGGDLLNAHGLLKDWVGIPDEWLRPIRPDDLEDETPREILKELTE